MFTVDHFTQNSWRPKWPIFFQDDHGSFLLMWHHSYISYHKIYNSSYPLPTTSKLSDPNFPIIERYNHQPTNHHFPSCGRILFSSSVIESHSAPPTALRWQTSAMGVSTGRGTPPWLPPHTPQVKDLLFMDKIPNNHLGWLKPYK